MTIVRRDPVGETLAVDPLTALVRADGIIICKRVVRAGVPWLQFKDGDRMRSCSRGTAFVEIPLDAFQAVLSKEAELDWPYNF